MIYQGDDGLHYSDAEIGGLGSGPRYPTPNDLATPKPWHDHAAALLSSEQARYRDPVDAVAKALADAYEAGLSDRLAPVLDLAEELDWLVQDETVDETARITHAWVAGRIRRAAGRS